MMKTQFYKYPTNGHEVSNFCLAMSACQFKYGP